VASMLTTRPHRPTKHKKHKTTIQSLILYRCKTWSHTLNKEDRFTVYENRAHRQDQTKMNTEL